MRVRGFDNNKKKHSDIQSSNVDFLFITSTVTGLSLRIPHVVFFRELPDTLVILKILRIVFFQELAVYRHHKPVAVLGD